MKLRIEKPVYGGAGLARADGKAVFVPFTLPGELVEARVAGEKRGYATAEPDAVIEKSPARTQPACPYFGRCGGCHYQHADYAAQVEMKVAILRETLERARIAEIPEILPVAGAPLAYRNRVRLHIQKNPFALCYRLRESHTNLPIATCPIAAPALQRAIEVLNRGGAELRIAEWAREVELFVDRDESSMLAAFWTDCAPDQAKRSLAHCWPRLRELYPTISGAGAFCSERGRRAGSLLADAGEKSLLYRCGERVYQVSLGSFFQVNRFLIEQLVQLVTEGERGRIAWDLYAGAGLFSLPLSSRFEEVVAVEAAGTASRDLHQNLRGTRHRVVGAETVSFLRRAMERHESPADLVVVDPPRAGLGRDVTSLLGKLRPRNITYVSCDPATLSRDLAALLESGYRLRKLHLIDMFPQTFHLESVTHLSLD